MISGEKTILNCLNRIDAVMSMKNDDFPLRHMEVGPGKRCDRIKMILSSSNLCIVLRRQNLEKTIECRRIFAFIINVKAILRILLNDLLTNPDA